MKLRDELTKALVYAVEHYPAQGSYRGHLTEEEYNEIKKEDLKSTQCQSLWMAVLIGCSDIQKEYKK